MEELKKKIGSLLWEDWHGRFKEQNIWWSNGFASVCESFEEEGVEVPQSAKAVQRILQVLAIHLEEAYPTMFLMGFALGVGRWTSSTIALRLL